LLRTLVAQQANALIDQGRSNDLTVLPPSGHTARNFRSAPTIAVLLAEGTPTVVVAGGEGGFFTHPVPSAVASGAIDVRSGDVVIDLAEVQFIGKCHCPRIGENPRIGEKTPRRGCALLLAGGSEAPARRPAPTIRRDPAMTSLATAPRAAQRGATQGARSVWMARLGRVGLGARGVLYIMLAYLAVRVAFGQPTRATDKQGALHTVARQPFGHVLLAVLAVGFGSFAIWQLAMAAWGGSASAGSDKTGKRVIALVNGVVYGVFCASTIALAVGSSGSAGGDKPEADLTSKVMRHSFGRITVGAVGAAVIVIGAVLARRAMTGKRELELKPMGRPERQRVEALAKVGLTAKAVIVAAAGVLFVQAALAFDPNKAKGLDGTLKSFAHTPVGPWLLVLIAGGVLAFGLYSLAEARYAQL
jgi:hypothetical protein